MNLVLPIDSLLLKFEGLLRDYAYRSGTNVIGIKNESQKMIFIEDILNNPNFRKSILEYDWLLFNYIFTNRGINLRNKIAHCFYKYEDYRIDTLVLVIFSILRLSKYNLNAAQ
jgi:hypothetical protein